MTMEVQIIGVAKDFEEDLTILECITMPSTKLSQKKYISLKLTDEELGKYKIKLYSIIKTSRNSSGEYLMEKVMMY